MKTYCPGLFTLEKGIRELDQQSSGQTRGLGFGERQV
jgi:hypothetical protein